MYTVRHLAESGKSRHFSVDPVPRHSSFNLLSTLLLSFFFLLSFRPPPFRNHQLNEIILSRAPFVSKIQRATRISQLCKVRSFVRFLVSMFPPDFSHFAILFFDLQPSTIPRNCVVVISTRREFSPFIWQEFFKYCITIIVEFIFFKRCTFKFLFTRLSWKLCWGFWKKISDKN